jgi:hypothetical protein
MAAGGNSRANSTHNTTPLRLSQDGKDSVVNDNYYYMVYYFIQDRSSLNSWGTFHGSP